MVDRYVVQARIAKIRQYVALLKRIRGLADERAFVKDPLIYGNAERYLQLAIQAVLDISQQADVARPGAVVDAGIKGGGQRTTAARARFSRR